MNSSDSNVHLRCNPICFFSEKTDLLSELLSLSSGACAVRCTSGWAVHFTPSAFQVIILENLQKLPTN